MKTGSERDRAEPRGAEAAPTWRTEQPQRRRQHSVLFTQCESPPRAASRKPAEARDPIKAPSAHPAPITRTTPLQRVPAPPINRAAPAQHQQRASNSIRRVSGSLPVTIPLPASRSRPINIVAGLAGMAARMMDDVNFALRQAFAPLTRPRSPTSSATPKSAERSPRLMPPPYNGNGRTGNGSRNNAAGNTTRSSKPFTPAPAVAARQLVSASPYRCSLHHFRPAPRAKLYRSRKFSLSTYTWRNTCRHQSQSAPRQSKRSSVRPPKQPRATTTNRNPVSAAGAGRPKGNSSLSAGSCGGSISGRNSGAPPRKPAAAR